jgi:hypothetical protein
MEDCATLADWVASPVRCTLAQKAAHLHVRDNRVEPGAQRAMGTAQGPFPMKTTYNWTAVEGHYPLTLQDRAEPTGFSKLASPAMASAMRRADRKDLARLRSILEAMWLDENCLHELLDEVERLVGVLDPSPT